MLGVLMISECIILLEGEWAFDYSELSSPALKTPSLFTRVSV